MTTDSETTDHDSRQTELTIDAPETARPDEIIPVRLTGAPPGEEVDVVATMDDAGGCTWRSNATFRATESGTVDLTEQAPVSGTYEGVRPMGWLWSMEADNEDRMVTELMHTETTTVRLAASTDDRAATHQINRGFDEEAIRQETVTHEEFVGTIVEPAGEGPHPGVVVLHGSGGHSPVFEAALLAAHGFSAFALQYIGEADALPENIVDIPVTYFDIAATWFSEREHVTDESLGIVGHSRGAEIGLWLAAHREWAGPVVSYAGSPVLWDTPTGDPAWLDETGEELPAVSGQGKPTLCDGQLDDTDPERVVAATVPVEDVDGPVLFISGGKDPIWPAQRLADIGMERLADAAVEHDYDHLTNDQAGHFITPPYLPKSHHMFGGTPTGMAQIDASAWPLVLEYLGS